MTNRILERGWRAAARAIIDGMPEVTLRDVGLRKAAMESSVGPVALGFALGAAAGIGLLLTVAPGSEEMRRTIASRLRHARDVLVDAEVDIEDKLALAGEKITAIVTGQRREAASTEINGAPAG